MSDISLGLHVFVKITESTNQYTDLKRKELVQQVYGHYTMGMGHKQEILQVTVIYGESRIIPVILFTM